MALTHAAITSILKTKDIRGSAFHPTIQIINLKQVGNNDRYRVSPLADLHAQRFKSLVQNGYGLA